jgi:putative SOS response-associated peptidase YedK
MANDRMYLVNTVKRYCVCIAVRFGGEWKQWTDGMPERMYKGLADEARMFYAGLGTQNWRIEYEQPEGGIEHDTANCLTCTGKYVPGETREMPLDLIRFDGDEE